MRKLVLANFNYYHWKKTKFSKAYSDYFTTLTDSSEGENKIDTLKFLSLKSQKADHEVNGTPFKDYQELQEFLKNRTP